MKKYLALGLIVSLLFPYLSFAYDIESIYNDKISSEEIRRDKAIQNLSVIYDTHIVSTEKSLQEAKAMLEKYQWGAINAWNMAVAQAMQSGLTLSEGAKQDIYNDAVRNYNSNNSNITRINDLITTAEASLNKSKTEKEKAIEKITNESKIEIDKLKQEKQSLLNGTSSSDTSTNTNTYIPTSSTNSNTSYTNNCDDARNNLKLLYIESTKDSYSTIEIDKRNIQYKKYLDIAEWISFCLATYTYQEEYYYSLWRSEELKSNDAQAIIHFNKALEYTKKNCWSNCSNDYNYNNITKKINYLTANIKEATVEKTLTEKCQSTFGVNSYSKGIDSKDWKNACDCSTGYEWNTSWNSCIKKIITAVQKTPTEICQESFGINSHSKDGGNICDCLSGYKWNTNQDSCIKKPEEPLVGFAYDVSSANKLATLWIINNHSDNIDSYSLYTTITRREMLKIMMNLSKKWMEQSCKWSFKDLKKTDWWCAYAESALNNGFIVKNSYFRPNDNVSKVEAIKMIFQAMNITVLKTDDWRVGYVAKWVELWLFDDFTDYDTKAERSFIFNIASKINL